MGTREIELLLEKKRGFIETAVVLSREENMLIKLKAFEKTGVVDAKKNSVIQRLIAIDMELAPAVKSGRLISENAKQIIENINSSLNDLIKLEKENEVLISQAGDSISGKYIDLYKAYRRLK